VQGKTHEGSVYKQTDKSKKVTRKSVKQL